MCLLSNSVHIKWVLIFNLWCIYLYYEQQSFQNWNEQQPFQKLVFYLLWWILQFDKFIQLLVFHLYSSIATNQKYYCALLSVLTQEVFFPLNSEQGQATVTEYFRLTNSLLSVEYRIDCMFVLLHPLSKILVYNQTFITWGVSWVSDKDTPPPLHSLAVSISQTL